MTIQSGTITDEAIKTAFGDTHASYTLPEKRKRLEQAVLEKLVGYASSHTLTGIMINLKLIGKNNSVLKLGRLFLYKTFKDNIF